MKKRPVNQVLSNVTPKVTATNTILKSTAPKTTATNYTVGSNAPGKVIIKPVSKTGIPTNTSNLPQGVTQQVMPKDGYGIGFGTVQPGGQSKGYTDKNAEIERTQTVIKNREAQGMDNTAQLLHYKNLTGKDYGSATAPAPTTPTAPPSTGFDMEQFSSMFGGYNEQNNSRFSALEKMIQEMMNGQKYNQAQQGQQPVGQQQAVYDGTHQFTAPNQGANVGYTQNNDAMNQTLYKYLNGMWKGGI
jgi:hypothetical protein